METLLWIVAILAIVLGLAGLVLPLLPGTPLLFGGFWLAAWLDQYAKVSTTTVIVLGVLALLAWLIDYVAAVLGVKRVGASPQAITGAALGTLMGLFAGLPGLIVGPIIGATLGEWVARKNVAQATRAGMAAGIAFFAAMVAKVALALSMLGVFILAYLV